MRGFLKPIRMRGPFESGSRRATPANIFGARLAAWYESDYGTYQTSGGTTAAANNDPIGEWRDRSNNARHLGQSTDAIRPLLKTGILNGYPGILFNGTDQYLTRASFQSQSIGMVAAVFRTVTVPAATQCIWATADAATGTRYLAGYGTTSGTLKLRLEQRDNDTLDRLDGSTTIAGDTSYLATWRSDGSAFYFRANGSSETLSVLSGANNGDWAAETSARDNFTVGALIRNVNAMWCNSYLFALVVVEGDSTAVERDSLQRYWRVKYGGIW